MGIFGKLFKGPEIDQVKSADSKQKMRRLFDSVVPDGGQYQLALARIRVIISHLRFHWMRRPLRS